MRTMFPEFYRPTEEEFQKLWQECIFSFDANVLLNIYRYSPATTENFFSILERLHERVWIPHQAALEYQKNRLNVISQSHQLSKGLQETIKSKINEVNQKLKNNTNHLFLPIVRLRERSIYVLKCRLK